MPKRKCTFTNDLKREYPYLKETVDDKDMCAAIIGWLCFQLATADDQILTNTRKPKNTSPLLRRQRRRRA